VVDQVVGPTKTTFLKNRYIMGGVFVLHETVNSMHSESGIMFKVRLRKGIQKNQVATYLSVVQTEWVF
jgi:hypothetical protein